MPGSAAIVTRPGLELFLPGQLSFNAPWRTKICAQHLLHSVTLSCLSHVSHVGRPPSASVYGQLYQATGLMPCCSTLLPSYVQCMNAVAACCSGPATSSCHSSTALWQRSGCCPPPSVSPSFWKLVQCNCTCCCAAGLQKHRLMLCRVAFLPPQQHLRVLWQPITLRFCPGMLLCPGICHKGVREGKTDGLRTLLLPCLVPETYTCAPCCTRLHGYQQPSSPHCAPCLQ